MLEFRFKRLGYFRTDDEWLWSVDKCKGKLLPIAADEEEGFISSRSRRLSVKKASSSSTENVRFAEIPYFPLLPVFLGNPSGYYTEAIYARCS